MTKAITFLCLTLLLLFTSLYTNSYKEVRAILNNANQFYKKHKIFSEEYRFRLFISHTSNQVKEDYKGYSIYYNDNKYAKIGNNEIINLKDFFIKIDNQNKLIKIYNEKIEEEFFEFTNFEKLFTYYKKIELKESKATWICVFSENNISPLPYSKLIMHFNKSDCKLIKQELYFLKKYKTHFVNGKPVWETPRLEISLANFKTKNIDKNIFNQDNYLVFKKNKHIPVKKYASYSIID